jgi:hypothetical protein
MKWQISALYGDFVTFFVVTEYHVNRHARTIYSAVFIDYIYYVTQTVAAGNL